MQTIGQFQILGEIGRGGMGIVYRALDRSIHREVAIKTLSIRPGASADEVGELRARFSREASAAGRLSHPNIVSVFQFGEDAGCPYIVMELVKGTSLESLLQRTGMDVRRSIAMLRQMAAALDYAHARGMFHRDVKPANFMVLPDDGVKVMDFGVVK